MYLTYKKIPYRNQIIMDPDKNLNENTDGEWSSVGKGGKGGKNKKNKKKNTRTVTLQTFITENGGLSPDGLADKEDSPSYSPELSDDEELVRISLLSYFTELLSRLGPVKKDE